LQKSFCPAFDEEGSFWELGDTPNPAKKLVEPVSTDTGLLSTFAINSRRDHLLSIAPSPHDCKNSMIAFPLLSISMIRDNTLSHDVQ
jgi:hypothetical protein